MFSGFGHFPPCFFTMTSFCANFRKKIDKKKSASDIQKVMASHNKHSLLRDNSCFCVKKLLKNFFFLTRRNFPPLFLPPLEYNTRFLEEGIFPGEEFFFFFFLTMFRKICRKYLFSAIPAIHWASHFHTPLLRDNSRFGAKSLKR